MAERSDAASPRPHSVIEAAAVEQAAQAGALLSQSLLWGRREPGAEAGSGKGRGGRYVKAEGEWHASFLVNASSGERVYQGENRVFKA